MEKSNINPGKMETNRILELHQQEKAAKEVAKTDSFNSKKTTLGNTGPQGPVSDPNANLLVGNMMSQVCGGVQSSLAALQGIIFENEQKLMQTGTELAKLNYTAQGAESNNAYTASVAAGQAQKSSMRDSAIQGFTNAGVTGATIVAPFIQEKFSGDTKTLDALNTKQAHQEKLAELTRPTAVHHLPEAQVTNDPTLSAKETQRNPAIEARAKEISGGLPFKKFDETKYPQESEKYNHAEGSHYVEELDEAVIRTMKPEERAAAHAKIEEQLKATKQEINTATQEVTNRRGLWQQASQFATQIVTGSVSLAQAPLALDQKTQEAVAAISNQAVNTENTIAATATKMRETAVEEGKNAVAALVQAMNVRG